MTNPFVIAMFWLSCIATVFDIFFKDWNGACYWLGCSILMGSIVFK